MRPSATTLASEMSDAELALLTELIATEQFEGAHLEVGTAAGGTLKEMIAACRPPRPRFVVVDSFRYFPDQRAIVERNLRSHGIDPATVDFREAYSAAALAGATAAGESFDFILIDAHHDARHVIRDLRWAALLRSGGLICLHDYASGYPGVRWAVDRFMRANANYRHHASEESLIALRKTGDTVRAEVGAIDVTIGEIVTQVHRLGRSLRMRWRRWRGA